MPKINPPPIQITKCKDCGHLTYADKPCHKCNPRGEKPFSVRLLLGMKDTVCDDCQNPLTLPVKSKVRFCDICKKYRKKESDRNRERNKCGRNVYSKVV